MISTIDIAHLESAKRGDQQQFSELIEPYRRPLQAYCYRLPGSLQEVSRRKVRRSGNGLLSARIIWYAFPSPIEVRQASKTIVLIRQFIGSNTFLSLFGVGFACSSHVLR
ncbi:MAG: hypothetical protein KF726_11510 [Anaerolineae bacterium]|nr:hypothetical protein [Anaerolineae bacterium]